MMHENSCAKTTDFFEKLLRSKNYAGVREALKCEYAKPIHAYRKEYLRGVRGERDGKRAAVFMQAIELKNAAHNVLRFHLAMAQMGYDTTILPEELAAAMVSESCGCKCAPRTYRRAKNEVLVPLGWLHSETIPTGQRIATKFDSDGNPTKYVMKQICIVKLTPASKLLIARKSELLPRPKEPIAPTRELNNQHTSIRYADCSSSTKDNLTSQKTSHASQEPVGNEVAPTSETATPSHVKHRPVKKKPRHSALKSRLDSDMRFGRRLRNKARGVWASNRASFLSDLYRVCKNDELHRIAALQSDLQYPPLLPSALKYERYVFEWHEHSNDEAKRIISREILPSLNAFVANLLPPKSGHVSDGYKALHRAFTGMSEQLTTGGMPDYLAARVRENSFMLNRVPWLLTLGKLRLKDVRREERELFRFIADGLGWD